ncbi:OsmC family protein [[Eubacterium] cellulosolvens]
MSVEEKVQQTTFKIELELIDKLQFNVKFDLPEASELLMDEPPVFGGSGLGPNASRAIAAGVSNCLSASLAFCLRKTRADLKGMKTVAHGTVGREEGLLRLQKIDVKIYPKLGSEEDLDKLERCRGLFEKYCIVTESIRRGLPVNIEVVHEIDKLQ